MDAKSINRNAHSVQIALKVLPNALVAYRDIDPLSLTLLANRYRIPCRFMGLSLKVNQSSGGAARERFSESAI